MVQDKSPGRRQRPNQVACAIDDNMVYPLLVLGHSLKEHQTAPFFLTIGYLQGTLAESARHSLTVLFNEIGVEHEFLPLAMDQRFITQGHISPTTFAKFLLADAIPGAHVWIDADTVALPGWDGVFAEISNAPTKSGLVVAERKTSSKHLEGPGNLPFNAGVLGWPARKRREWSKALSSLPPVATQEQYLFNQLYSKDAHWVSERYNTLTYTLDRIPSSMKPFIIHYAGAHKPWHLRRNLNSQCLTYHCPWSEWFVAEDRLLTSLNDEALMLAEGLAQAAVKSGRVRWQRDHSGLIFLRALLTLGPLAPLLVWVLTLLTQWIPRGTHPIHSVRS